jgi:hypothetical protein
VIRNVVVHIANEQPLMADLFDLPAASDAGLLCTNLRSMDGKRPVFIDKIENTFFFPYRAIRFLEIPVGALDRHQGEGGGRAAPAPRTPGPRDAELETTLPAVIEVGAGAAADLDADVDDELDEEFLRRIRDV